MEKLRVAECVGYTHIETEGGRGVAYDMLAEDARRVVACVNKFAGMSTDEIEALPANVPMLLSRLSERSLQVDQLQEVCAEAYQFAGAYDAPVEVLDNLHAAANGLPLPHESFLPVDDSELVKQRDQLLEALEEMVAMMDSGEEHGAGSEWHQKAAAAIAAVKGE